MSNQSKLNPTSLTIDQLVRVLTASGGQGITAEQIRADVATGAPTNPDGTINLVPYVAWLAKEMNQHGSP